MRVPGAVVAVAVIGLLAGLGTPGGPSAAPAPTGHGAVPAIASAPGPTGLTPPPTSLLRATFHPTPTVGPGAPASGSPAVAPHAPPAPVAGYAPPPPAPSIGSGPMMHCSKMPRMMGMEGA